jgi:hypothetical protein
MWRLGASCRIGLATVALVVQSQLIACDRSSMARDESTRQPDIRLSNGRVLTDVFLDHDRAGRSLSLWYQTSTSLSDCKETQTEVREVWSQVLRGADKGDARGVVIFPEDTAGRSQGFRYIHDQDGTWREENFLPCPD